MTKRVLILVADNVEDYEVMVPYQTLKMLGYRVDAVCPGKRAGEKVPTTIHDLEGDPPDGEKPGHNFTLNAAFSNVKPEIFDALLIAGGAPERLASNPDVRSLVRYFAGANKVIAAVGSGAQVLAASEVVRGRRLTCSPAVAPEVTAAGGEYVPIPGNQALADANLVTSAAWPANPEWLCKFLRAMHAEICIEEPEYVTA